MQTPPARPRAVYLIRHGEKPGDPADDGSGGPDLSIRGAARAAALPALFTPAPTATGAGAELSCALAADHAGRYRASYATLGATGTRPRFATPQRLIATQASKHSNRPVETVTAVAQALGLTIHHGHADADYGAVAAAILSDPTTYGGTVVLIAWHHGKLPALARALGAPAAAVTAALGGAATWPATVFDWIWQITWDAAGAATLTPGYQRLLFGDAGPA